MTVLEESIQVMRRATDEILRLRALNDELVAALKLIAYGDPRGIPDDMIARDALAKAEAR